MPIIDVHTHVGRWMYPIRESTMDDLVAMEHRAGVDVCVVSSASAIMYDFKEGNRLLAEELERYPQCLGYVVVNPHYVEESLQELATYRQHPRFAGVKLHGDQQGFALDDRRVARLIEAVAAIGWPVLVHTFSAQAATQLRDLAHRFPTLAFIMAHMGGADWPVAIAKVADVPNIYLDPCSSYAHAGKLETAVAMVGANRVVFGSDATLFNPWFVRGMVESAALDESTRRRIYFDNAVALFGERLRVLLQSAGTPSSSQGVE